MFLLARMSSFLWMGSSLVASVGFMAALHLVAGMALARDSSGALPATPPAEMPVELRLAAEHLQLLMRANPSIRQPVALMMQPFHSPVCAGAEPAPPSGRTACFQASELPALLQGSSFAAYVHALRTESEPTTAPDLVSIALPDRTILLNADSARSRDTAAAGGLFCSLGSQLAALELDQPRLRQSRLEPIDAQLVTRIHRVTERASATRDRRELSQFLLSPLLLAITKATTPPVANPTSQQLLASGQWRLLRTQSPSVAAALEPLAGFSDDLAQRSWRDLESSFAFALLDRDALLASLRHQAQNHALMLLAAARIDPGTCAAQFDPPPSVEALEASMALYKAGSSRGSAQGPLPSLRYQSDLQRVLIQPRILR